MNAVVIGGGTGTRASIRACLRLGFATTAVVAMADDGGSSGILRANGTDVSTQIPPGDIRNCLVSMSDLIVNDSNAGWSNSDVQAEAPSLTMQVDNVETGAKNLHSWASVFQQRLGFLDNHCLGNLIMMTLAKQTGSFVEAILICEQLLGAKGHVLPSTLCPVSLRGVTCDNTIIEGQSAICATDVALRSVELVPVRHQDRITAYDPALDAIQDSDIIILGPGSLYTSIVATLQVPGIADVINNSKAVSVFVAPLFDGQGETRALGISQLVAALKGNGLLLGHPQILVAHGEGEVVSTKKSGINAVADIGAAKGEVEVVSTKKFETSAAKKKSEESASTKKTGDDVSKKKFEKIANDEHLYLTIGDNELEQLQSLVSKVVIRKIADLRHPWQHDEEALADVLLEVI